MIAAILAVFTSAALLGQEPPELAMAFRTLDECQSYAARPEIKEPARQAGVVVLCLQIRTGV